VVKKGGAEGFGPKRKRVLGCVEVKEPAKKSGRGTAIDSRVAALVEHRFFSWTREEGQTLRVFGEPTKRWERTEKV